MSVSIYENTIERLISGNIESPRLEARLLIADILKIDANEVNLSTVLEKKLQEKLEQNISKRLDGMPLDKILGHKSFYKYDFNVNESVLSPRPETEILVEKALELIQKNHLQKVADFGVGSGCILLSLLKENPSIQGVGIDISQKALKIASDNAGKLEVEDRCQFICKSWFDEDFLNVLGHKFDLIVSNPPYIKTKDILDLDVEVRHYDPFEALDGGEDGLKDYRKLSNIVAQALNEGG